MKRYQRFIVALCTLFVLYPICLLLGFYRFVNNYFGYYNSTAGTFVVDILAITLCVIAGLLFIGSAIYFVVVESGLTCRCCRCCQCEKEKEEMLEMV